MTLFRDFRHFMTTPGQFSNNIVSHVASELECVTRIAKCSSEKEPGVTARLTGVHLVLDYARKDGCERLWLPIRPLHTVSNPWKPILEIDAGIETVERVLTCL